MNFEINLTYLANYFKFFIFSKLTTLIHAILVSLLLVIIVNMLNFNDFLNLSLGLITFSL